MVKDENYIVIPGWAINKLKLKGNNLIIYSIIYSFSQTPGHYFNGSLNYLQEWTESSRAGVLKNINSLISMGLIIKEEDTPTNKYYANLEIIDKIKGVNKVEEDLNKVDNTLNKVDSGCQQSLHNNINNNIINNKNNKYILDKEINGKIEEIISYLNSRCNTKFKPNTSGTKKIIKARLSEGFTLNDFKKVIDYKYETWGKNPIRFQNGDMSDKYLRPSTLFGDKFETYVYESGIKSKPGGSDSVSVKQSEEDISNLIF